jgi:hypothetical protein
MRAMLLYSIIYQVPGTQSNAFIFLQIYHPSGVNLKYKVANNIFKEY